MFIYPSCQIISYSSVYHFIVPIRYYVNIIIMRPQRFLLTAFVEMTGQKKLFHRFPLHFAGFQQRVRNDQVPYDCLKRLRMRGHGLAVNCRHYNARVGCFRGISPVSPDDSGYFCVNLFGKFQRPYYVGAYVLFLVPAANRNAFTRSLSAQLPHH